MSRDLTNDSDPVPMPPLPGISEAGYALFRRWSPVVILTGLALVAIWYSTSVYADYLWHDHLGYDRVFLYLSVIRIAMFILPGMLAATLVLMNISLAFPLALGPMGRLLPLDFLRLCLLLLRVYIYGATLVVGVIFGASAGQQWDITFLAAHQMPFGVSDPQFGMDATFYAATLPSPAGPAIVAAGPDPNLRWRVNGDVWLHLHAAGAELRPGAPGPAAHSRPGRHPDAPPGFPPRFKHLRVGPFRWRRGYRRHLHRRSRPHSRVPVPDGDCPAGGGGVGVSIKYSGLRLMAGAFTLWLIMFLLAGILYPALFQRFRVNPNEFAREQTYIQRNIDATRAAYALEHVREEPYPVVDSLTEEAILDHRRTIEGIRLWDAAPLQDAYNQLQFMELYYTFLNMDSDRYVVDGRLQQVLIGVRELDPDNLPGDARNWVNQRLQYTHGYGVSMSSATGYTLGEGRPEYLIQDIPIKGALPVSRPEIYYGEAHGNFAIVGSAMREVNPDSASWSYDGRGGVALDSFPAAPALRHQVSRREHRPQRPGYPRQPHPVQPARGRTG